MTELWTALAIAAAGGLGATARHLVDSGVPERARKRFPWGIFVVNLSGSLALGIITGMTLNNAVMGVWAVGFLGGYTTFSTASFDSVRLLRERRFGAALLNGPGMLVACVALAVFGILLTRG